MGVGMFAGGSLHLALRHPEAFPHGIGGIPAEFNRRVVEDEDRLLAMVGSMLEELGYRVEPPIMLDNPIFYTAVAQGDVASRRRSALRRISSSMGWPT